MEKHRWNTLRPIAIAVTLAFAAEQVAFAAPAVSTIMPASLKPSMNFKLPQSVAVVDDAYKAPGDAKLLILIQDAHTNDSGQMNVARALSEILPKEKIDTVFTEADSGDVSLGYMKPLVSQDVREKVGRQMVRRGELRGHDYANLTGPDFKLIGVEDPALYRKTLETYKDLTLKRDKVRGYVDRVQRSAEAVKGSLFSDAMKALEAKRLANAKGDLSLADYADTLLKESSRAGLSSARYPHIKFLRRLRTIEKRVDFKKASAEERAALKALPVADRELLLAAHKTAKSGAAEENGFYALFAEKLKAAGLVGQFPDLKKYFDYLAETRKMNALGVVGEVKGLEEELFLSLAENRDEAVLWLFGRNLETLQNLINLKLSPDEFRRIRSESPLYDIKLIAGFLNRKIADLKLHYENALTLDDSYGSAWADAVAFYELTLERDRVFLDRVTGMMNGGNIEKAVLITGGYHTPNLKEMLKASGYSYVALLPQVLHETDSARYERLLLAQLKDSAAGGARIASGSRPARQEAAMTQQQPGVLAARLAAEVGDPGLQARLTAPVRSDAPAPVSAARMAETRFTIPADQWQGGENQKERQWTTQIEADGIRMIISIDRFLSDVQTSPTGISFTPAEGEWTKSDSRGAYETSWNQGQGWTLALNGEEVGPVTQRFIAWRNGSDDKRLVAATVTKSPVGDINVRLTVNDAPASGARMTTLLDQSNILVTDGRNFELEKAGEFVVQIGLGEGAFKGQTSVFFGDLSNEKDYVVVSDHASVNYLRTAGMPAVRLHLPKDKPTVRVAVFNQQTAALEGEYILTVQPDPQQALDMEGSGPIAYAVRVDYEPAQAQAVNRRIQVDGFGEINLTLTQEAAMGADWFKAQVRSGFGARPVSDMRLFIDISEAGDGETRSRKLGEEVGGTTTDVLDASGQKIGTLVTALRRTGQGLFDYEITARYEKLLSSQRVSFDETSTPIGPVTVELRQRGERIDLEIRHASASAEFQLPTGGVVSFDQGQEGPVPFMIPVRRSKDTGQTVGFLEGTIVKSAEADARGYAVEFRFVSMETLQLRNILGNVQRELDILNRWGESAHPHLSNQRMFLEAFVNDPNYAQALLSLAQRMRSGAVTGDPSEVRDRISAILAKVMSSFAMSAHGDVKYNAAKEAVRASVDRIAKTADLVLIERPNNVKTAEFTAALQAALNRSALPAAAGVRIKVREAVSSAEPVVDAETARVSPQGNITLVDERIMLQYAWMYQQLEGAARANFVTQLAEGLINAVLHTGVDRTDLKPGEVSVEAEERISNQANAFGYTEISKLAHLFEAVTPTNDEKARMLSKMMNASGEELLSYHYAHPDRAGPGAVDELTAAAYHRGIFDKLAAQTRHLRQSPVLLKLALYHLTMFLTPVLEKKESFEGDPDYKKAVAFLNSVWDVLPVTGRQPLTPGAVDDELRRLMTWGQNLKMMDERKAPSDTITTLLDRWNRETFSSIDMIEPLKAGTTDEPADTIAFPEAKTGGYTHVPMVPATVFDNVRRVIGASPELDEYLSRSEGVTIVPSGAGSKISRDFLRGLVPFFIGSMMIAVPNGGLGTRANTVNYEKNLGDHDWVPNSAVGVAKSSMQYDGGHTILQTRLEMAAGLNRDHGLVGSSKVPVYLLNSRFTNDDTRNELVRFGYQIVQVSGLSLGEQQDYTDRFGVSASYFKSHPDGVFAVHSHPTAPVIYIDKTADVPLYDPFTGFPIDDPNEQWSSYHAWVAHLAAFDPVGLGKAFVVGANVDNLPGSSNPLMLAMQAVMGNDAAIGLLPTPPGQKGGAAAKKLRQLARNIAAAIKAGLALFHSPLVEGFEMNPTLFEEQALKNLQAAGTIASDKTLKTLTKEEKSGPLTAESNRLAKEYMGLFNTASYGLTPGYFQRLNAVTGITGKEQPLTRLFKAVRKYLTRIGREAEKRYLMGRNYRGAVQTTLLQGFYVTGFGDSPEANPFQSVMYLNYSDPDEIFQPIKAENPKNIDLRESVIEFAKQRGFTDDSKLSELVAAAGTIELTGTPYDPQIGGRSFTKALGDLMMTYAGVAEAQIRTAKDPQSIKLGDKDITFAKILASLKKERENLAKATASVALYPTDRFIRTGVAENAQPAEGARMAEGLSAKVVEWVKWAGEVEPVTLGNLTEAERNELAYVSSRALAPNQTAEVPMVVTRGERGPALLAVVEAQLSGQSVNLAEGETSVAVGLSTLTALDTDAGRKAELDEQAGDMSAFSGSLRALLDAVQINSIEVPVHFRRSLDSSSVDEDKFTGDKVTAFATWVRQMAMVYRLAHQKDNRIVLHLVTTSLAPALKAAVENELKRYESEGWLDLVREGDVTAEELARTGALLVDVKTTASTKHLLAAGAHVVGRLTNGAVPDEAAAVAASLNTVGAVTLGEGASAQERFASGKVSGDADALDRIKQNYDEENQTFTLPEHVEQFREGTLDRVTRILKISIGRLLQTMRMMITQVAMAA